MMEHEVRLAAHIAVKNIERDLRDRRGLKSEWDQCEPAILREIRRTWEGIVMRAFGVPPDVLQ